MKKILLSIIIILFFTSCMNTYFPIKNSYKKNYSYETKDSYDKTWNAISELIFDFEITPTTMDKQSGLIILEDYPFEWNSITREHKKDSTILINSNAYLVSPFYSNHKNEFTDNKLNKYNDNTLYENDLSNTYPEVVNNLKPTLFIKLNDNTTYREVIIKIGNNYPLESTGKLENQIIDSIINKLRNND